MATANTNRDEHSLNIQSEETPLLRQGCAHCSWKVKLEDFSELKPGDHICIDGRMFRKTLIGRPKTLYNHHAMVAKVDKLSTKFKNFQKPEANDDNESRTNSEEETRNKTEDENSVVSEAVDEQKYDTHGNKMAVVTLIEVNREENSVVEESYAFDLKLLEIYKVVYDNDKRPSDAKLKAAQRQIDVKWDYGLLKNNCEHFCNECCTGDRSSVQAETSCHGCSNVNLIYIELTKYIMVVVFYVILTAVLVYMSTEILVLDIFLSVWVSVIFYLLIFKFCFWNGLCCLSCRRKCTTCRRYYVTRCIIKISIWLFFQGAGSTIGAVVLINKHHINEYWQVFLMALTGSVATIILVLCVSRCYKHPIRRRSYEKEKSKKGHFRT